MIRKDNPAELHFLVSSPPIIGPCYYGMDFPTPEELIANRFDRDIGKVADAIGVDSLRYLSAEGLVNAVKEANPNSNGYCTACFTEEYPVPVNVDAAYEKEENEPV
jgi:amidophosphoribosyltransferase